MKNIYFLRRTHVIQIRTIVSGLYVDQNAFMSAYVKFNNLVNTNILEYD